MTSKCGKNKKVARETSGECVADLLATLKFSLEPLEPPHRLESDRQDEMTQIFFSVNANELSLPTCQFAYLVVNVFASRLCCRNFACDNESLTIIHED